MSSIYTIGTELNLTGPYITQLREALGLFSTLDKKLKETKSGLGGLAIGRGALDSISKFSKELSGIQAIGLKTGKSLNEGMVKSFSGVRAEADIVKKAIGGWGSEVAAVEGRVAALISKMRSAGAGTASGGGTRNIRRGGHGGGTGLLDTIAMGPTESGLLAGIAIERAGAGVLEAAGNLQRQVNLYKLGGASDIDVAAGVSASYKAAAAVPDVGVAEQMKLLRELSGATGDDAGSRAALTDTAKTMSIMGSVTGRHSEEDMKRLFKFIELRGVAIDEHAHKIDVGKFSEELGFATKAIVAAQGLITTNDMQQFAKQAGPMAKGMSGADLFSSMLASMEDMGGARTGTALTAIGRQFLGGVMTSKVAGRLEELGLLNKAGVDRSDPGKITITDPSAGIKGYETLVKEGFGSMVEKVIRPALEAKGIGSKEAQNAELYRMGSTETGRRLLGLFLANKDQIGIVGQRFNKAMAGTEGYDKLFGTGGDFNTSTKAIGEAFTTLKTALGDASGVGALLMSLAKGISSFAETIKGQTGVATAATIGTVGVSASLLGYGALKTVTGFGLPAAATQLSAAAVALNAAAAKLGGGSLASDAAKTGALGAFGLGGVITGGIVVMGTAGYLNADAGLKQHGAKGMDPATGSPTDANPMAGMAPQSPWLTDLWKKYMPTILGGAAAEAGKGAALDVMKGFKEADFAGAGAAAGAAAAAALSSAIAASVKSAAVAIPAALRVPAASRGGGAGVTTVSVPPTAGPPPRSQQMVQVHSTVMMDRKVVARSVAQQFVADAKYPNHIGGMDTHGSWRPPGTTLTDAA